MLKVELDVMKQNQLAEASDFCAKHKCPTMVVAPDLVTNATVSRSLVRGSYKVLTTVDWPKGTQFLSDKFRGLPSEALNADGFEILLTPTKRVGANKEIKFLSDFFKEHFPPTIEFRFVLGWYDQERTTEHFAAMCEAMKLIPNPSMIRTTHLTKVQASEGLPEAHDELIKFITSIKPVPVKISGNVNMHVRSKCKRAERFACTLDQAVQLQKELDDKGLKKVKAEVGE